MSCLKEGIFDPGCVKNASVSHSLGHKRTCIGGSAYRFLSLDMFNERPAAPNVLLPSLF